MKIIISSARQILSYSTREIFQHQDDDSLMLSAEGSGRGRCMIKTFAIRVDNNRFLFTYVHCLNCILLQESGRLSNVNILQENTIWETQLFVFIRKKI